MELLDAALNWGGLVSGTINMKVAEALIRGYKSVGILLLNESEDVLIACIVKWGAWLEYNLNKAILDSSNEEEKALALQQVNNTFRNLEIIFENFQEFKNLLS